MVRITEKVSSNRDRIMVPAEILDDFIEALQDIRQANQEASAILDKAAADIELEKKKAINEAKDEISGMAIAIAEKVVGRELSHADQSTLVDSFIEELGEQI